MLLIAVGYLATAWVADCSLRTRWLYIGAYAGVLIASYPTWGWSLVGYGAYVAIMMATLLPWRQSRIAVVVLGLLIAATIPFGGGDTADLHQRGRGRDGSGHRRRDGGGCGPGSAAAGRAAGQPP